MDVFINSTFTHSMRGYRLMRLYSDGYFYDVNSVDEMGAELFAFFSEELFKYIWFEKAGKCYCCVKGIRGVFNNGKEGYIDLALKADTLSLAADYLTSVVINNYGSVKKLVFEKTKVCTNGDYTFDFDGFFEALSKLPAGELPSFVSGSDEPDALKAAVCIGSTERALEKLRTLGLSADKSNMINYEQIEKNMS